MPHSPELHRPVYEHRWLDDLPTRAVAGLAGLTLALSIWYLFASLLVDSLWQDEIYSMHVAMLRDFRDFLRTAAADTHPVTYYVLLRSWIGLAGTGEVMARMPSALASGGAITILMMGARPGTRWSARLTGAAFATTASVWLEHAGEARSYAISFPVIALAGVAFMRLASYDPALTDPASGRSQRRWAVAFVSACWLASTLHLFGILTAGYLCIALVTLRWRAFAPALVASIGCGIILAFYAWQELALQNFEVTNKMFEASLGNDLSKIYVGFRSTLSKTGAALAIISLVAGIAFTRIGLRGGQSNAGIGPDLALLLASVMVGVIGAMLSQCIVAVMTYRGPQLAAPLVWLGLIGLFDRFQAARPSGASLFALLCLLAPLRMAIMQEPWNPRNKRPDFRAIGEAIYGEPACRNSNIAILRDVTKEPEAAKSEAERETKLAYFDAMYRLRFGYYLQSPPRTYFPVMLFKGAYRPGFQHSALFGDLFDGTRRCDVLAIMSDVQRLEPARAEAGMRALVAEVGGDVARVSVTWYPNRSIDDPHSIEYPLAIFHYPFAAKAGQPTR